MKEIEINENIKECADKILKHHFPIATKVKGTYEIQGTCVAITDGERYFLLTAAHVTGLRHSAADEEIYICNWAGDEFIRIEEDIIGHDDSYESIKNEFDVSIIEIERNRYQSIPEENFLDIGGIYVDLGDSFDKRYLMNGFPASKNNSFPKYRTSPRCLSFFTEQVPLSGEYLQNNFTISVRYDNPVAPKPNGMSGGGLWMLTAKLPRNPVLAGILVSFIPGTKTIVAVKMSYIVSVIKGFFPGSKFDNFHTPMKVIETEKMAFIVPPLPYEAPVL